MHKFYKVNTELIITMLEEALSDIDVELKLDELDCSKSWARKSTDKTYVEIIDMVKLSNSPYPVFIHRKPHYGKEKLELGISVTENRVTYFIWCWLPIDRISLYIHKYNLKEL